VAKTTDFYIKFIPDVRVKIIEIGQCFTELLKKIIVACFWPRYIEGNSVFQ